MPKPRTLLDDRQERFCILTRFSSLWDIHLDPLGLATYAAYDSLSDTKSTGRKRLLCRAPSLQENRLTSINDWDYARLLSNLLSPAEMDSRGLKAPMTCKENNHMSATAVDCDRQNPSNICKMRKIQKSRQGKSLLHTGSRIPCNETAFE